MNNTVSPYLLNAEVVTPTGMNRDIALSVAKADLGRFNQVSQADQQRYTYAKADFLSAEDLAQRLVEMVIIVANALLSPLPSMCKPMPLLVNIPAALAPHHFQKLLEKSELFNQLSIITVTQQSGASVIAHALQLLTQQDIVLCIAVDSLVANLDALIADATVFCQTNPWGIIPSEGSAGMILCSKNLVDTLALRPVAKLEYFDIERQVLDRRAMMRLVRKASAWHPTLGKVYSNMTNSRHDSEDYGFALGARIEIFNQPQQPFLINELWGTLGVSSALALLAVFAAEHPDSELASLLMFEQNGDRAILAMTRCG